MKTHNIMQEKILAGLRDERGAGLLEYALIVSLITVASIVAISLVGHAVEETFDTAAASFPSADTGITVDYPTAINTGDRKARLESAVDVDTALRLQESPSALRQASQESQGSRSILRQASQESASVQSSASSAPMQRPDSGKKLTPDTGSGNQNPAGNSVLRLLR